VIKSIKWAQQKVFIVELFVTLNFGFLIIDIFIAHSYNHFRHWSEWIPFYFSIFAFIFLLGSLFSKPHSSPLSFWYWSGMILGYISILIGIAGLIFHLESQFFRDTTIKNLVYTAPFVAPLVYGGLGFILLLNRMITPDKDEWGEWLLFFAIGGFLGNFVLSLCDHAQNGFFNHYEWIPVFSSALAVGFLFTALFQKKNVNFLNLCFCILGLQVIVGLLGFGFHLDVVLNHRFLDFPQNIVYGAPIFAPLLFVNLSILSGFALWDFKSKL